MGSNVHFHFMLKGKAKPIPEDLGCGDSVTLPRYADGYEFIKAIWDQKYDSISICSCKNEANHDYFCDRNGVYRPTDFAALREKTKDLQPVWQQVIDYLESETSAYVEYD